MSLVGLTAICPLLLTCLFIWIVRRSVKLPGAFTGQPREDARRPTSAPTTVGRRRDRKWEICDFFFFFKWKHISCLKPQTGVNWLPCDHLNIPSVWYLEHRCQNKPRKVFAVKVFGSDFYKSKSETKENDFLVAFESLWKIGRSAPGLYTQSGEGSLNCCDCVKSHQNSTKTAIKQMKFKNIIIKRK